MVFDGSKGRRRDVAAGQFQDSHGVRTVARLIVRHLPFQRGVQFGGRRRPFVSVSRHSVKFVRPGRRLQEPAALQGAAVSHLGLSPAVPPRRNDRLFVRERLEEAADSSDQHSDLPARRPMERSPAPLRLVCPIFLGHQL